ncbi:MAG: hypothetical protein K5634_06570 [Sphaerochaetaceae bacterium]|nr:hypothetical protein [Sphaerochaetaceae bacterium]
MRKLLIVLIVLLSLNVVFASSTITEGQNGTFVIKGYYESSNASDCTFRLWSGDQQEPESEANRIYQSGFVTVDGLVEDSPSVIFHWSFEWTKNKSYQLTFSFTPLQSYVERTYFIPEHSFSMECNENIQTVVYDEKVSGSYKYPGKYLNNYKKSISYTANKSANPKELKGTCSLTVFDYEKELSADFEYISYITVEFKVI